MTDYGILSLLPPLVAIGLAILTKRVLFALFFGVWVGGLLVAGGDPIGATVQTLKWIVLNIASAWEENGQLVTDLWNTRILVFDTLIGAGVALIYKAGGMNAIAKAVTKKVKSSRAASLMAAIFGTIIFFDDYTNTIIVGNTMRPITDRTRVSREFLAYADDSTAAPVAVLAVVSTWIGYELGLLKDALASIGENISAYSAWFASWPYRFYPILAIILVYLVAITHRHYGPMLKAEYRARTTGKVLRDGAQPMMTTEIDVGTPIKGKENIWVFILPVITLIALTFIGLWVTGGGSEAYAKGGFQEVLSNADSTWALVWGSFGMVIVAMALILGMKIMDLKQVEETIVAGMKQMHFAMMILILAWSIKSACDAVGTADYVVRVASDILSPSLVPFVIFVISAFISFTTGTSWGTFAIMMPIAVPLAYHLSGGLGPVVYASIASVFAGGVFGDHCSPISDTTIMSSMFSGCDHIDHVNTQIPYALTAAIIGAIMLLLFAIGITNGWLLLAIAIPMLIGFHYILSEWYGKKVGIPHGKVPIYIVEE
ncbi:Na+/H+ antiporter NhaC family protein [Pyrococcus yayanosii]|uniref:Na+/H+ antiporter, putative, NhaC family n=1 Tax=Pyrococcus yayanosii (strain CH1 / JCM 16557) TaxID=529709 RepID=F8AIH8_PYRYC|nr:Na+/H+ antiporter NhaC family protein [Pyrococcus yayanosii]AEH24344.1 Na+/H+ antiporter, putative, NhaC family [Pyrococcus yayanosii CH1]